MRTHKYEYNIKWSEEDKEFVGTCAAFPSLSWLDEDPVNALIGIMDLVKDIEEDEL